MNFKKLWFWFSASIATGAPLSLFFGLGLEYLRFDGFLGLDFYHYIILGIILFPFLLKYLSSLAITKTSPNGFFWKIILATFISGFVLSIAGVFINQAIYGGKLFCC